ncbi:MAG: hypothetical protein ACJ786_30340 [Catenulispora sp.]
MSARKSTGPDMSGLNDLQRAIDARKKADQAHPEHGKDLDDDATASLPHDAATDTENTAPTRGRRAGKTTKTAKPRVLSARAMTVRMDPGEADEIDRFVLDLRDETGQRLDKADVVRELIRLARHDPAVRRKLAARLR